ncbi:hypothetical protein Slin15195_G042560 [Septoria linicola]|uniref:Uncharacterized protein n=1 Tax=Septoria linicola TaxID=215465 RepID=A0A9Q9ARX3_9PEZI|nr:hypothetical protein Slin14017_G046080 [Septoria linicola]USW50937.1 hypothetical protein Slin15195_G042560 [Septoria linicola]
MAKIVQHLLEHPHRSLAQDRRISHIRSIVVFYLIAWFSPNPQHPKFATGAGVQL